MQDCTGTGLTRCSPELASAPSHFTPVLPRFVFKRFVQLSCAVKTLLTKPGNGKWQLRGALFKQTALGDGRCCWRLSARAGSAVLLPSGAGMLCSRGVSHSQSRELPQPSRGLPRAGRRFYPLPLLSHRKIAFAVFLGLNSGTARMCLG